MSYIAYIRNLVGHHKIYLAYASVVLRDEQGRILLQRRADFDVWGLPGGCLELGEDILSCARRELLEESGLTAGPLRLVGVYSDPAYDTTYPNGDQVQQYTVCVQGELTGGSMRVDGIETRALQFFTENELPWDEMPAWYQAMIRKTLDGGDPGFSLPYTRPDPLDQLWDVRSHIGHVTFIGVGAMGATVRGDGRLLMIRRMDRDLWCFPGGYSNLGENVAYTVAREVQEETGLQVEPQRLLGVFSPPAAWVYPNGDATQPVVSLFRCRPVGGEQRPDHLETSQVAWMTPEEVLALPDHLLLSPLNWAILQHLDRGSFLL